MFVPTCSTYPSSGDNPLSRRLFRRFFGVLRIDANVMPGEAMERARRGNPGVWKDFGTSDWLSTSPLMLHESCPSITCGCMLASSMRTLLVLPLSRANVCGSSLTAVGLSVQTTGASGSLCTGCPSMDTTSSFIVFSAAPLSLSSR